MPANDDRACSRRLQLPWSREFQLRIAAAIGALLLALAAGTGAARATTVNFSYANGEQPFLVPADVFEVTITAIGGHGGRGGSAGAASGGLGGSGAWVRATNIPVIPGTQLYIDVGGNGGATTDGFTPDPGDPGNPGGFPNAAPGGGGGAHTPLGAGGGGGGATVVSKCLLATTCTPIVVAGGGGGGGSPGQDATAGTTPGAGGNAGGTAGQTGATMVAGGYVVAGNAGTSGDTNGDTAVTAAQPGGPGTDTASGIGGAGGGTGTGGCPQAGGAGRPIASGSSRAGGAGGAPVSADGGGGGGGGGGWFAGGGGGGGAIDACPANGGSGAGGGGGSSYAPAVADFLGTPASSSHPGVSIDYTAEQSPAQKVAVSFAPKTSLTANGSDQTTITARVTDGNNAGVPGEHVTLRSSNPDDVIGPVTDNHDGTYTATLLASTIAGTDTITATDTNANVTGTGSLTEKPGPPEHVKVTLSPTQIAADGKSTSTATALVTDHWGNPESGGGDDVHFASTDPAETFSAVTDHGNGSYTAVITASQSQGTWTITATDLSQHNISGTATLGTPGPPASISIALAPAQIAANGVATTTATITVNDTHGDGIAGQSVRLASTDGGQKLGTVTDNGDGSYTAKITASTLAGSSTITATNAGSLSSSATLTETAGPPVRLLITLSPGQILADQHSTTRATATIVDQYGNPDGKGGYAVTFAGSDPGQHFGPVTDNHDGSYSVTITASSVAGPSSIMATESTTSPALTGLATLDQLTPAPVGQIMPAIRAARIDPSSWRGRGKAGAYISFTLNQTSTVKLTVWSERPGRRAHHQCVAPTARTRHDPTCIRTQRIGTLRVAGRTGVNRIRIVGRNVGGIQLSAGSYSATLVATDAGGHSSATATLSFKIL